MFLSFKIFGSTSFWLGQIAVALRQKVGIFRPDIRTVEIVDQLIGFRDVLRVRRIARIVEEHLCAPSFENLVSRFSMPFLASAARLRACMMSPDHPTTKQISPTPERPDIPRS